MNCCENKNITYKNYENVLIVELFTIINKLLKYLLKIII